MATRRWFWTALAAIAVAVASAGYVGVQSSRSKDAVRLQVATVASHADNFAAALVSDSTTFGEAYKKAEALVDQADAALVALRVDQAVKLADREPAENYIKALQELARQLSSVLRIRQRLGSELDLAQEALRDITRAGTQYGVQAALDRSSKHADAVKVEGQKLKEAEAALLARFDEVGASERRLRAQVDGVQALEAARIKDLAAKHGPRPAAAAASAPAVNR